MSRAVAGSETYLVGGCTDTTIKDTLDNDCPHDNGALIQMSSRRAMLRSPQSCNLLVDRRKLSVEMREPSRSHLVPPIRLVGVMNILVMEKVRKHEMVVFYTCLAC